MRKLLICTAATCSCAAPSMAHYFNATYDCGGGQSVWIGNPVDGHGAKRERKLIYEIKMSAKDFGAAHVVQWNEDKDEVTLDGRPCHLLTDDEANKIDAAQGAW